MQLCCCACMWFCREAERCKPVRGEVWVQRAWDKSTRPWLVRGNYYLLLFCFCRNNFIIYSWTIFLFFYFAFNSNVRCFALVPFVTIEIFGRQWAEQTWQEEIWRETRESWEIWLPISTGMSSSGTTQIYTGHRFCPTLPNWKWTKVTRMACRSSATRCKRTAMIWWESRDIPLEEFTDKWIFGILLYIYN